jgi:putative colanic acid biosynthesis UDP-glucose lipid carrier transferase
MFGLLKGARKYEYTSAIPFALLLLEFAIVLLVQDFTKRFIVEDIGDVHNYILLSIIIALCWTIANVITGLYKIENFESLRSILLSTLICSVVHLFTMTLILGLGTGGHYSFRSLLAMTLFTIAALLPTRLLIFRAASLLKAFSPNQRRAIIIGQTPRGKQLSEYFTDSSSLPFRYMGYFDGEQPSVAKSEPHYLGSLHEVQLYCLQKQVSEIYYAIDNRPDLFKSLVQFTDKHFIFLGVVPDINGIDISRRIDTIVYNDSRIPVITSRKLPLHLFENYQAKRVFDILFSTGVLLALSLTLFPIIAIAICTTSKGPIFFKQLRPGKKNKLFWCYKFRTMTVNNETETQATKNDSRITKVGAFLRKTSLDELPQFFNVLKGDMSVVGPRPNLVSHLQKYPLHIKEYALRHWVTPGITGFAQVSGYRGETKELIQMQKRVDYDLQYIENWSLTFDLEIIGLTILNLMRGEKAAY